MEVYTKKVEIRWSDLDPNQHLRHSAYYDFGAFCRVSFLNDHGLSQEAMLEHHIGPILFREECIFKREVRFNDDVFINMLLVKSRRDGSRWTMRHEIWKNNDVLAAVLTLDGAWLDLKLRKLSVPPAFVTTSFDLIPRANDFTWSD